MALIKCTECGQMISDRASICPRCGCPVNNEQQVPQNSNMVPPPTYYYNDNRRNNNIWPYVVIAVLLVALVGGGFYFYDKNKQQELALQKKLIIDSIAKDSIAKRRRHSKNPLSNHVLQRKKRNNRRNKRPSLKHHSSMGKCQTQMDIPISAADHPPVTQLCGDMTRAITCITRHKVTVGVWCILVIRPIPSWAICIPVELLGWTQIEATAMAIRATVIVRAILLTPLMIM